eukprot:2595620-Pyramimonas_sp.AAC.1
MCDRKTRAEVVTSTGTLYLGRLQSGDYQLLWVAAPADWHAQLPGKRARAALSAHPESHGQSSGLAHVHRAHGAPRLPLGTRAHARRHRRLRPATHANAMLSFRS